jgi:hypothetical protein
MKNLFLTLLLFAAPVFAQAPSAPVITSVANAATNTVTVTITEADPAYEIHFTIDGSTPTAASPLYVASVVLTKSATVEAIAVIIPATAVASKSFTINPCLTGTPVWTAFQSISSQARLFHITFDSTATASMDGVTGLSHGPATDYTGNAVAVRFNTAGVIDMRNAGTYAALNSIPYTAGTVYHFALDVNIPAHTYSASVNGAVIGTNFAFRTEQAAVASLDTINLNAAAGTHTVCNVQVSAPVVAATHSVALSWIASVSPSVTGYSVLRGLAPGGPYTQLGNAAGLAYVDTAVQSGASYFYVLSAFDAVGDVSANSAEVFAVIP